jgi:hypothetical protein
MQTLRQTQPRPKLSSEEYDILREQVLRQMDTGVKTAVRRKTCTSITLLNEVSSARMQGTTSSPCVFSVIDADMELDCRKCWKEQDLFRSSQTNAMNEGQSRKKEPWASRARNAFDEVE